MADPAANTPLDAASALALGKRHLLVCDYNNAVSTLVLACELLAKDHGERADELAEPYLLYARALLGLAREESNVLGSGVPGTKDSDEEEDVDDDEEGDDEEKDDKTDEKDSEGKDSSEKKDDVSDKDEKTETVEDKDKLSENKEKVDEVKDKREITEEKERMEVAESEEKKDVVEEKNKIAEEKKLAEENKLAEEKKLAEEEEKSKVAEEKEKTEVAETEKSEDKEAKNEVAEKVTDESSEKKEPEAKKEAEGENKVEEQKMEESKEETETASKESSKVEEKSEEAKPEDKTEPASTDDKKEAEKTEKSDAPKDEAVPGSSKMTNGESSTGNDSVMENGEEDDDVDNLQVAWEVLELAKLMLVKRGPPGWKLLSEAHKLLGEVAMEGGNANGAMADFQACLDLLQKLEPCEPRAIAEIYYQLGLSYSFTDEFDVSIEKFQEASSILEARIKELEQITEPPKSDDPFYSVAGEIKELKELLPEIAEKISDMKDAKQETYKRIKENMERTAAGSCSNGASTSGSAVAVNGGASSSGSSSGLSKKSVNDISHLIRKKRKQESEAEESSPCKKPSTIE